MHTLNHFDTGNIRHGFFGRQGGVSIGIYDSLNCKRNGQDNPDAIRENRARVAARFGIAPENVCTAYQIHSPDCAFIDVPFRDDHQPRVDALVTARPGILLGVLTADCAPVLFHAHKADGSPIIGAAHAGWKGALAGILESTIKTLCDHGAQLLSIRAAVGPCIAKKSYEVSVGFEEPFLTRDPNDALFFHATNRADKLHFDLPGYVARRLAGAGVRDVALSDIDTLANDHAYFSYRRNCRHGLTGHGCQISVISIN